MHETVLLKEAVDALVVDADGIYVDGTFGRGGHSREILARLTPRGRLLAIDKDPEAIAVGEMLEQNDKRFDIEQGSFADAAAIAGRIGLLPVQGVLLDLGVSSPQLDQAGRGFSFLREGPLDMRMDPSRGVSAADWIARASADDIAAVLKDFGEERYARRIARAIVEARAVQSIDTTTRLAGIVAEAHPAWEKGRHPATKAFQGIRIFINDELGDLERFLDAALDMLAIGGRLVIISFHSLEDRMVKRFIKRHVHGDNIPKNIPVTDDQINRRLRQIGKAIRAGRDEISSNVRSRSAIMRVAEKIA